MRISEVQIRNYRSIKYLSMRMQDLTILVGPNNAGKTNILGALRLFFNPSLRAVSEEDFYLKNLEEPIEIVVTFSQLNEREKERFADYLSGDSVTVKKTISYNKELGFKAKLQGQVREPKNPLLKASQFESNKIEIKRKIDQGLLPKYFLNQSGRLTKDSFENGVKKYIKKRGPRIAWDEPSWSDSFFGWKSVAEGYMMDILYLPAVKEASEESKVKSNSYFGELIKAMISKLTAGKGFAEAKQLLERVQKALTGGADEERAPEIKEFEEKLSAILHEYIPDVKAKLDITVPQIEELVRTSTLLTIDDGVSTSVEAKGHGLQRLIILTIFRMYADLLRQSSEAGIHQPREIILFEIEEPELYLHPQLQRLLFEILRNIAQVDQVICCTHSPYFVSIRDYRSITLVIKDSLNEGTKVRQIKDELFKGKEDEQFKLLAKFDPHKNELFFARKVVLVEGLTDKSVIELVAKRTGKSLDEQGITIVVCEGKRNIPLFQEVLNAFSIPYTVIHDTDIKDYGRRDALRSQRRINYEIRTKAKSQKVVTFDPDLETECGLKGKGPFEIYQELYKVDEIPLNLKKKVADALS